MPNQHPLAQAPLVRALFITITLYGTPAIHKIKMSSHETVCQIVMNLNMELVMALVSRTAPGVLGTKT